MTTINTRNMARLATKGLVIGAIGTVTLLISTCLAAETQTALQKNAKLQKSVGLNTAECGTLDDLAKRVEVCAKPLMDILQGRVAKWPRNEDDALALCNDFAASERCIRDAGRKCAKGIHRTIISTLANSIGRVRKRECNTRTKLADIVKLTSCIEKHQYAMQTFMANQTGRLEAIELQTPNADKKIQSLCCIIKDIEKEVSRTLNPFCPKEAALTVRLYQSCLQDVVEIVCRNPKCKDYMKGYRFKPNEDFIGIIAVILRIVFSLELD